MASAAAARRSSPRSRRQPGSTGNSPTRLMMAGALRGAAVPAPAALCAQQAVAAARVRARMPQRSSAAGGGCRPERACRPGQQAEASVTDENASREQAAPAEPQEQCVVPSLVPNGAAPAPVAAAGPWAVAIGQIGSTLYQVAESSWNDDADEEHDEQQDEQPCHREVAAMTVVAADNADDEHAMQRAEPARPDSPGLVGPGKVSAYEMPAGLAVPRLEGSRTGGDVGVCSSVCSSKQLLWFSILHQAALLLLGFLGWLVSGCRPWLTLSSYLVVGVGLWVTHWAGHRRWVSPAWFDFHTIGHHVRPICTPTTAAAVAVARPAVSQC